MIARRVLLLSAIAATFSFTSCQEQEEVTKNDAVSELALSQISKLGFSNKNVIRVDNGYIVEGDILLTNSDLKDAGKVQALRVGEAEQYRTTNLVKGLPRVITVATDPSLPRSYAQALDIVVARYNAEGLQITFKRVSSRADITMKKAPATAQYLASAGFPTAAGNPFSSVTVNSRYMGVNPDPNYLATILAHEIGHCIGFRHTDYMDRSYSCGGDYTNEGPSVYGAIQIPGTPAAQDPNSWMLACIGTGDDRPFNANDKTALDYLY